MNVNPLERTTIKTGASKAPGTVDTEHIGLRPVIGCCGRPTAHPARHERAFVRGNSIGFSSRHTGMRALAVLLVLVALSGCSTATRQPSSTEAATSSVSTFSVAASSAGATSGAPSGAPSAPISLQPSTPTVTPIAGLFFRHPTSWVSYPPGPLTPAPIRVVAYLTNQPAQPPCTATTTTAYTEMNCPGPVTRLVRNGVLVTFTQVDLARTTTRPSQTIAGMPAAVSVPTAATSQCVPGTLYEEDAMIDLNKNGLNQLRIVACTGPGTTQQTTEQTTAMIRTATYSS
jgi:hypothetical protein